MVIQIVTDVFERYPQKQGWGGGGGWGWGEINKGFPFPAGI
jgi:hypothetical protein